MESHVRGKFGQALMGEVTGQKRNRGTGDGPRYRIHTWTSVQVIEDGSTSRVYNCVIGSFFSLTTGSRAVDGSVRPPQGHERCWGFLCGICESIP
jgi:hypothetical protein